MVLDTERFYRSIIKTLVEDKKTLKELEDDVIEVNLETLTAAERKDRCGHFWCLSEAEECGV